MNYLPTRNLENHHHSVQGSLKKLVLTIIIHVWRWGDVLGVYFTLFDTNERVFSQGFIKYSYMNIIEHPFH